MKQEEGEEGNEQEERCVELFWLKPHLAEFVGSSRSMAAMKATALATAAEMKKSECSKILDALAEMGATQVKSAGKFVVPSLAWW